MKGAGWWFNRLQRASAEDGGTKFQNSGNQPWLVTDVSAWRACRALDVTANYGIVRSGTAGFFLLFGWPPDTGHGGGNGRKIMSLRSHSLPSGKPKRGQLVICPGSARDYYLMLPVHPLKDVRVDGKGSPAWGQRTACVRSLSFRGKTKGKGQLYTCRPTFAEITICQTKNKYILVEKFFKRERFWEFYF